MKKILTLLSVLLLAGFAAAQGPTLVSGNITAQATSCQPGVASAACVILQLSPQVAQASITINGTFTATVQFEWSPDGGTTWVALSALPNAGGATVTSATGAGVWTASTGGASFVRVRGSAYTSGVATVTLNPSQATNAAGSVGGGSILSCGTAGGNAFYSSAGQVVSCDPQVVDSAGTLSLGSVGGAIGRITFLGSTSGSGSFGCSTATCTQLNSAIAANFSKYVTNGNCAANGSAAQPSVVTCAGSSSGTVSCSTSATSSCQVNTTAVTAVSHIFIVQRIDTAAGTNLGVTCNTTVSTLPPLLTGAGINTGTSFTFQLTQPVTNPNCYDYFVVD